MPLVSDPKKLRKEVIKRIKGLMASVKRNGWTCCQEGHLLYRLIGRGGSVVRMELRVTRLIQRYNDITNPIGLSIYMRYILKLLGTTAHKLYDHVAKSASELLKSPDTMVENIIEDNRRLISLHRSKECICYL